MIIALGIVTVVLGLTAAILIRPDEYDRRRDETIRDYYLRRR